MRRDHSKKRESYKTVYKVLFVTIAPVILSATVYNISDFVDTALFNNVMAAQGFSKKEYASLLGIFQGLYRFLFPVHWRHLWCQVWLQQYRLVAGNRYIIRSIR